MTSTLPSSVRSGEFVNPIPDRTKSLKTAARYRYALLIVGSSSTLYSQTTTRLERIRYGVSSNQLEGKSSLPYRG